MVGFETFPNAIFDGLVFCISQALSLVPQPCNHDGLLLIAHEIILHILQVTIVCISPEIKYNTKMRTINWREIYSDLTTSS